MKHLQLCLILLGVGGILSTATAQTTLHVLTKSTEKTFSGSQAIRIEAEKADIELLSWKKDEIKMKVELIAKHPDRQIAAQDLEAMQQLTNQVGKDLVLKNYILVTKGKPKPSSNLKAKYTVYMPEGMTVTIRNAFGKIGVKGKTKQLNISADFCSIELNDLEGGIKLNTQFGDLRASNLNAVGVVFSERSEVQFSNLSGTWRFKTIYGKIDLNVSQSLKALHIESEKAEVQVNGLALRNYGFLIKSSFGKCHIPQEFSFIKNEKNYQTVVFNPNLSQKITITNTFGNISINQ